MSSSKVFLDGWMCRIVVVDVAYMTNLAIEQTAMPALKEIHPILLVA
jgi:hypothetical protein